MAQNAADPRPFPPGEYGVIVIGSGPGGLQISNYLTRLGIDHAVLSADPSPGGMFRQFPFFQRLLSWTKPHAQPARDSREFERYDFNSLLAAEPENRAVMPRLMDGSSEFPSRGEMEAGLVDFVERTNLQVRYDTPWEGTSRDGDSFVLHTPAGDYRTRVPIFAVGAAVNACRRAQYTAAAVFSSCYRENWFLHHNCCAGDVLGQGDDSVGTIGIS